MEKIVSINYENAHNEHIKEIRELVFEGLNQAEQGQLKNFDSVCDRLEKKYHNAAVQS